MSDDWFISEQLHFAAADGDIARAQRLLADGYDPNAFDQVDYTPLHHAVEQEHFDMVSLLLAHGADINAHNVPRLGNTPIRQIAGTCSLKMARFLLDSGADPTICGWMQLNALDVAKERIRGDGQKVYELLCRHAAQ